MPNTMRSTPTASASKIPDTNIEPWLSQAQSSIAAQLAAVNATSFTVNPTVTVSNNVAYVTGLAPVNVDMVWINGVAYPLTWTTLTNWIVTMPLVNGTNTLSVVGVDINGQPITGDNGSVNVIYNGTNASPVGQVVINEIMYAPAVANAQFVELYNNSTNTTFDLSGWQLQALSYTFPNGSILAPTNYLILAENGAAFAAAYGATNPVFDTFSDTLPASGTLALNTSSNVTVAEVAYENQLPWPTNADGTGASLQLIDPHQDNWRVGNWAAVSTNAHVTLQWTYVTATGTASSSTLYIYLQSAGDVYVDDIKLVAGSVPEAGTNVLSDGDFESGFPGPWTVSTNLASSVLSTTIKHSGNASLHVISTSAGTTQSSAIWQIDFARVDDQCHLHVEFLVSAKHQRRAADTSFVRLRHCRYRQSGAGNDGVTMATPERAEQRCRFTDAVSITVDQRIAGRQSDRHHQPRRPAHPAGWNFTIPAPMSFR